MHSTCNLRLLYFFFQTSLGPVLIALNSFDQIQSKTGLMPNQHLQTIIQTVTRKLASSGAPQVIVLRYASHVFCCLHFSVWWKCNGVVVSVVSRWFEALSVCYSLRQETLLHIVGSRDGTVVRALAFHQCGPGSIPRLGVICGLSLLLVLVFAPRGFSPGTPVFPSPQKPTFLNSNSIRIIVLKALYHQPLAREIAQAFPVLFKLNLNFFILLSLFTQVHKWVPVTYCWGLPCSRLASNSGGSSNQS